jgi:lysophospholipase L1-like esterase
MPPRNLIVLGDSVSWGQGLVDDHKYPNLLADTLGIPREQVQWLTHSGAVIFHDPPGIPAANGEVPTPDIAVLDQIDRVANPGNADVVIVCGGINDVGLTTILDPWTSISDLRAKTQNCCGARMEALLESAASVFTKPDCQILVGGYYPILSPRSDPFRQGEEALANLLGHVHISYPVGLSRLEQLPLAAHITDLCMEFWNTSSTALAGAVTAARAASGCGQRLAYVPSPFTEDNALFASQPMLWGMTDSMAPADEVILARKQACDIQYPASNPLAREFCYRASVGHPTVAGAALIARQFFRAGGW